jgi:hypothetical protein
LVARIPLALARPATMEEAGELHATLKGHHELATHELVAELDAYVCPDNALEMMVTHCRPPWLPPAQVVRLGCDAAEASDAARDIFHSWVRQVKNAIPSPG